MVWRPLFYLDAICSDAILVPGDMVDRSSRYVSTTTSITTIIINNVNLRF